MVALLRQQRGQAAVEFFFVMIGMVMIMGLLVTLFSFAQDVFFETTRARAEMLEAFHKPNQYEVWGDTEYKPTEQIKAVVRRVPYLEKLVSGVPEFKRELRVLGGTAPTLIVWPASAECLAAGGLVTARTPAGSGIVPGTAAGAVAAGTICMRFHWKEY